MKLIQKLSCRKSSNNNNNNNNIAKHVLLQNSSKILESFGWFQVRSLILINFSSLVVGLSMMSFVFLNMVPTFKCGKLTTRDELLSNVTDNTTQPPSNKTSSQCVRYLDRSNWTSKYKTQRAQLNITFESESCINGLIFDTSHGNTVASQFKLVCEDAWKRPLSVISFVLGMTISSLLGGRLSDRFGRRRICLLSSAAAGVLTLITAFSPNFYVYVALLFITGSFWVLLYFIGYAWALEIAGGPNTRAMAGFWITAKYGLGGCLLSVVAYVLPDWKWIFITKTILNFISFILFWFAPESPSWLLQKGKFDEAARILKNIVTTNKMKIDYHNSLKSECSTECKNDFNNNTSTTNANASLLWKNKTLRKRSICICLLWISTILSFTTFGLNSANLGGSPYLNNAIGCGIDIFASAAVTIVMRKFGRKPTLATTTGVLAVMCCILPFAKQRSEMAGVAIAMVGRFLATSAMLISILLCGELFPTMLRSTAIGIASTTSRIAVLASPVLVFVGEEIDLSIPFYAMGGIAFASIYLIIVLPETSNAMLLNTLEDALALKDLRMLPNCKICSVSDEKHFGKASKRPVSISTVTSTISSA